MSSRHVTLFWGGGRECLASTCRRSGSPYRPVPLLRTVRVWGYENSTVKRSGVQIAASLPLSMSLLAFVAGYPRCDPIAGGE